MVPGGFEHDTEEILERGALLIAGAILIYLGLKSFIRG
jgi:hypothetical protein